MTSSPVCRPCSWRRWPGISVENLAEEEKACLRDWANDVDRAALAQALASGDDDSAALVRFAPELVVCMPSSSWSRHQMSDRTEIAIVVVTTLLVLGVALWLNPAW